MFLISKVSLTPAPFDEVSTSPVLNGLYSKPEAGLPSIKNSEEVFIGEPTSLSKVPNLFSKALTDGDE